MKTRSVAFVDLTATLVDGFTEGAQAVIVRIPEDGEPYRVLVWTPGVSLASMSIRCGWS